MKKEYKNLRELLSQKLDTEEDVATKALMDELKIVSQRGYFTKKEFIKIGMWKSPRPKRHYLKNSHQTIRRISEKVLTTDYEKRKIDLLIQLKGVEIPTASAILTLIDPDNYGVIDVRVWQVLYHYGSVNVKPTGTNFSFQNWYNYLMKIQYYADMFKVKTRDVERTLYEYHKEKFGKINYTVSSS